MWGGRKGGQGGLRGGSEVSDSSDKGEEITEKGKSKGEASRGRRKRSVRVRRRLQDPSGGLQAPIGDLRGAAVAGALCWGQSLGQAWAETRGCGQADLALRGQGGQPPGFCAGPLGELSRRVAWETGGHIQRI